MCKYVSYFNLPTGQLTRPPVVINPIQPIDRGVRMTNELPRLPALLHSLQQLIFRKSCHVSNWGEQE